MRKLRFHEQKLLKQVNFLKWKSTNTEREQKITSKFFLKSRDDYHRYNCLVGKIRKLSNALSKLKDSDETKNKIGRTLVQKLFSIGIIENQKLIECKKINVTSFCKRRVTSVMIKNKMAPHTKAAVNFVEQGHVRLGMKIITDTDTLVSRGMEDYLKWVDSSKIKNKIQEFNGEIDDYDV